MQALGIPEEIVTESGNRVNAIWFCFRDSMLYNELEQKAVFEENEKYFFFGDQAYGLMELLITPFPGRPQDMPAHQRQFNQSMKILRVSVEWGFQKIVSLFAFVAALLTNCHTCLYGSQTADYFNTVPPTLEE
ncbi:hypothetical protein RN001_004867 [Aquatica leii]|uniref:DDE Tnp4 domain-containing protein n=1 Tax=Aquatica leii TaxID=1421715 RepID=A0AAN7SPP2_9COLE|nr:hypothetical protein RN001_004867 [Aquatica leii]